MNDEIKKYLEMKQWCLPYNENDLLEAIQLGKDLTIEEIRGKMILLPINGVATPAITETMLKEMSEKI